MKLVQSLKKNLHHTPSPAITSPKKEAFERYGQEYHEVADCLPVGHHAVYHTTSEFDTLDSGYVRHCGPTAMVNLIMTLASYYEKKVPDPSNLFRHISRFGRKRHFYFNMDLLKHIGGTLNLSVYFYMKSVLRKCHFQKAGPCVPLPARPWFLKRQLEAGRILFVILSFHPRYGAHHLVVYGYREFMSDDGNKKKLYLLTADGWEAEPRYLNTDDLCFSTFVSCKFRKK